MKSITHSFFDYFDNGTTSLVSLSYNTGGFYSMHINHGDDFFGEDFETQAELLAYGRAMIIPLFEVKAFLHKVNQWRAEHEAVGA